MGALPVAHALERIREERELAAAVDEWDGAARTGHREMQHRPGGELPLEALRRDHPLLAEGNLSEHQLVGGLADQDLPRLGRLLATGADVDLGPDDEVAVRGRAHRHGSRVDTDPDLHRHAQPEVRPQTRGTVDDLEGRAHRPLGVVGMNQGHPEHPQHGVADVGLGSTAQGGDLARDEAVEGGQHLPETLRIELGGQLCGTGEVNEGDRDHPAL